MKLKSLAEEQQQTRDFDPEAYDGFAEMYSDSDASDTSDKVDLSRDHYVKVGKSQLRRDALELDPKYKGKLVSRKEIISESEEAEGDASLDSEADENFSVEDSEASGDDKLQEEMREIIENDQERLKTFSLKAEEDAERGEHTKNQIKFGESLLDLRIRSQRVLVDANNMPSGIGYKVLFGSGQMNKEILALNQDISTELKQLVDVLLDIQQLFVRQNSQVFLEGSKDLNENKLAKLSNPRKRARDDDFFDKAWNEMNAYDKLFLNEFKASSIDKWNRRTQATSNTLLNKKFKSLNQDVSTQISQILSSDKERLMHRTRVIRSSYKKLGRLDKTEEVKDDENAFDDHDFYSALLKEFIEKKTGDTEDLLKVGVHWAKLKELQAKTKKKKEFERKATKGRKLKFNVHEKLTNFMVPVPTLTWHQERIDELFTSLSKD